ncbi:hemolysin III family protein [Aliiglaciecola sp. CAU 1673]|uniref:PAQR family membrane homeostasis protein TrhA n=1 Tax=Aliiglaciecola sp. CAU 1673 TaxID=3032595 RepID=UPI0023DC9ABF|nr:hemolysin III family protein [Aliiglaciecola sp. CAU 1673]MDF2180044.1 hemolysin III family protein [Aliiglaciecola sp. CAU 1673]
MSSTHRPYSPLEEWLNALSHGIGFIVAIVGLVFLLLRSDDSLSITASSIYGGSLLLMFLTSTLYHAITHKQIKGIFKLLDHSAIYLLIAGTYTPFMLVSVGGWVGTLATALIWTIAAAGLVFKWLARHRFPKLSVILYLIMGWLAVAFIYPLYQALPGAGMWLLVAGGLCFSIGVAFYVAKRYQFTHAIWHLFVVGGCACHYFSIYYFVL